MKILMVNDALVARGGSESYLETIAWALRRLGHDVSFFSPTVGEFANRLVADGFPVSDDPISVAEVDVIHGQHASALAKIRARFAATPTLFAIHSWFIPIEDPLSGLAAGGFVAFNDITLSRLKAHPATTQGAVHRLSQPVDITFQDRSRIPIRDRARSAVIVSRYQRQSTSQIASACRRLNIDLTVVGSSATEAPDARVEMFAADIVFASGRTAVEAMAAGRAVYVIDESTLGGWVTPGSYDGLEADGFTGIGGKLTQASLEDDLAGYRPEFGRDARRLAVHSHSAQRHAAKLIEVYQTLSSDPAPSSDVEELGRLSTESMGFQSRLVRSEWANAALLAQIHSMQKHPAWLIGHPRQTLRRVSERLRPPR